MADKPSHYSVGTVVALAMTMLAACAQPHTSIDRFSTTSRIDLRDAIILPAPGGPALVGVVEKRYSNAIQQEIALATNSSVNGQNYFRVQMFGPIGGEGSGSSLPQQALTENLISREMRREFPGIEMVKSPIFVQNGFGPFGYAIGRKGTSDLCIYAWQRLSSLGRGAPFSNVGAIHIRLRLCQTGASEQSLLAVMYGFTVNSSFSSKFWNPYGRPQSADPRLGSTGQPIFPTTANGVITVLDPLPPLEARRSPAAVALTPTAEAIPEPARVPAGAPVVPLPPNSTTHSPVPVVPPPPSSEN